MKDIITYTAADALTDALVRSGVSHVFLNSGTDYPPIIESWAKYDESGRTIPEIIISPHETAALSAAQGYAQLTGKAQAVFVHVDVGTQNLGGTIHNAFRCRIPVFVFAGLSPYTMEGELKGGRNAQIQFLQNVGDQASIIREYTKLSQEYRSGKNIQQMTYRALQIANSDPKGPVYLMATREVLEEEGRDCGADLSLWQPLAPGGLNPDSTDLICDALINAENPLIITSYLGRQSNAVDELVKLSEKLAVPVIESYPSFMNFPADNLLHLGYDSHNMIKDADVILVIDCDMPWIPAHTCVREGCRVFYIDTDPLKEDIPLWYIPSERFIRADSLTALRQLNNYLEKYNNTICKSRIDSRRIKLCEIHNAMRTEWKDSEELKTGISSEYLTACIREVINDDTIILNETISDHGTVSRHLPRVKPGTLFTSGGSSLGWHGGAAIGMKLARPESDVVALCGDGTYIFSCPTAVYWMARKYKTPFMTIIYNNSGWKMPKLITMGEHPDGYAVASGKYWSGFDPSARLDLVAEAAGGAFARTVSEPDELIKTLKEGKEAVKNGIPAVINVILPPV